MYDLLHFSILVLKARMPSLKQIPRFIIWLTFIVIPLILFLLWPDEFELLLVCTKWTSSFGCFEIVSAINGLIRLFDTSSPFITPGQWFMPSNWQWVVINFVALKKNTTHIIWAENWYLQPQRVHSEQFLIFLVGNWKAKKGNFNDCQKFSKITKNHKKVLSQNIYDNLKNTFL